MLLRPPLPGDLEARRRLGVHAQIERGYGNAEVTRDMSHDEARAWYDEVVGTDSPTYWHIETSGELVGHTFLHSVSRKDRKARFAIGMFAPQFLGRGLGSEATRLVLSHAFGPLGLHRVDLRVLAFNTSAIACYRACGFVEEGRERDSCWLDGAWHDDVIMAVLAT